MDRKKKKKSAINEFVPISGQSMPIPYVEPISH